MQAVLFLHKKLPKIKILLQIKKLVNKIQLTHISIKEWNFLIVRSVSLYILIIIVVIWFPSNKSCNPLPDFTHTFLSVFTKMVGLSPSENYVFNFIFVVMVVTMSSIRHRTRVSDVMKAHTILSLIEQKLNC